MTLSALSVAFPGTDPVRLLFAPEWGSAGTDPAPGAMRPAQWISTGPRRRAVAGGRFDGWRWVVDLGIKGRTALVCASTSGLGEATARALGAEGANVVVSGRRAELAESIAAELPSAIGVGVDMTAPDGSATLLDAASSAFGEIDILVLNGPGPRPATAAALDTESIVGALHNLLLVQQQMVAAVLSGMRERRWGRILSIASSGVVEPLPHLALSNIGRSALAAYLKSLATEVASDGVTVNLDRKSVV